MFRLAEVEDDVGVTAKGDGPSNQGVADIDTRMDLLTRRVADLETKVAKLGEPGSAMQQVNAPFEVLDKAGNPIFVVADAPHVSVARKGRIQIGRGASGTNYSMLSHTANGVVVAGLGESGGGGGALALYDRSGVTRVQTSEDGLFLSNKSAVRIVALQPGPSGAGQFWLTDASGRSMVSAGTLGDDGGIGAVMLGPGFTCSASAGARPPSCIKGRVK